MVRRQGKAINKTTRGLMIIFDLDGVLADCAHRRHFVDSDIAFARKMEDGRYYVNDDIDGYPIIREWKPDWQAYHEACDKDELIKPVCYVLNFFMVDTQNVEVWTSRSESVRKKTEEWFEKHIRHPYLGWNFKLVLKMRPIGNTEPIEVLNESLGHRQSCCLCFVLPNAYLTTLL